MYIDDPFKNGFIKKFAIFFTTILVFLISFFILTKIYHKPKKILQKEIKKLETPNLHKIVNKKNKISKEHKSSKKFELLNQ